MAVKAPKRLKGFATGVHHKADGEIPTQETVAWLNESDRTPTRRAVFHERVPMTKLQKKIDPDNGQPALKRNPVNQIVGTFTERVEVEDLADKALPDPNKEPGFVRYEVVETDRMYRNDFGPVVFLVREYIKVDQMNGGVAKHYSFRPNEEEVRRQRIEADAQARLERLAQLTPAQIDRLADLLGDDDEDEAA